MVISRKPIAPNLELQISGGSTNGLTWTVIAKGLDEHRPNAETPVTIIAEDVLPLLAFVTLPSAR